MQQKPSIERGRSHSNNTDHNTSAFVCGRVARARADNYKQILIWQIRSAGPHVATHTHKKKHINLCVWRASARDADDLVSIAPLKRDTHGGECTQIFRPYMHRSESLHVIRHMLSGARGPDPIGDEDTA